MLNGAITIKKSLSIVAFISLGGVQLATANMLAPASYAWDNDGQLGFGTSNQTTMYLGQWRNQILNRLNPSYFNALTNTYTSNSSIASTTYFTIDTKRFTTPVFLDSAFAAITGSTNFYFSFSNESMKISSSELNQWISKVNPNPRSRFNNAQSQLLTQDYYSPGYILSHKGSAFGIGAVLVQQRFLDNTFGSVTLGSVAPFTLSGDSVLLNTNRGIGYQLNFTQKLPAKINFTLDYRSEIIMNEFDLFGQSYSDSGNFDIPSQYSISVEFPVFNSNKINFSSETISYSDLGKIVYVHSGYSQTFLNAFNNPVLSPIYKLKDLTIYSIDFQQELSDNLSWNFAITSRQQASATAKILNNILMNDTASMSYKLGISHSASVGQFDLFASFSNKPIMFGRTDFGRVTNYSVNNNIEGVASWSFKF